MTSRALPWLMVLIACADFRRGELDESIDASVVVPTDGGAGRSFATSALPVLIAACKSCHQTGGTAAGSGFVLAGDATVDLARVRPLIEPASPSTSRLLTKAAGRAHSGGMVLAETSADYQTLFAWISEGANP